MNQSAAETIALKGLAFLANAPDSLDRFLALSGTSGAELRAHAEDPEFLAALMDFVLSDESLLTAFCEAEALDARQVHSARRLLPGA